MNLAAAIDAWEPTKRYSDNPGSVAYGRQYAKAVRTELGAVPLGAFCQVGGEERLRKYVRDLERGDFGPKYSARSIRNRLSILRQVLRWCTGDERGWLPYVPMFPELPKNPAPRFSWIGETDFRHVRERIYQDTHAYGNLVGALKRTGDETPPLLYVARRKLYLSWVYYTGARTHDADELVSDDVGLDMGVYIRHARKTGIPLEQFELPTPLADDLRAYLAFCGREHFHPAEPIGGGPWSTVARVLEETAQAAKLGHLNPRILRRSYARRMFELGYTEKEVADRMGHVDLRMLHEIYARTPRAPGRARSLWPRFTVTPAPSQPTPPRKVVQFPSGSSARNVKKESGNTGGEG
jgi:integrase